MNTARHQTSIHGLSMLRAYANPHDFDPLTGMRLVPLDPWTCFADDGGAGGDDDPPKDEKKYSKDDVEKMIKDRLKKSDREKAKLAKDNEKLNKTLEGLQTQFSELQDKYESSNKSDVEKELAKLQRDLAQTNQKLEATLKEKDEAVTLAAQATDGLKRTKLETTLREALRKGKAHGQGMDQAVQLMLAAGANFDEEGNFVMKVADVPYDKAEEAAVKWLEQNTHFQEGAGGGAGTPRSGGNGKLLTPKDMSEMSPLALIAEGQKAPPKTT